MPIETTEATPEVESANESITDNQQTDVATESANESITDNQEGHATEIPQEQNAEQTREAPKPYTYEELQSVKNFTELDPTRLPKPLADAINSQKAAQSELTKLQQRLSVQEKTQQTPQRPADPRQAFAYDTIKAFEENDMLGVSQLMNSLSGSIERRKLQYPDLMLEDPEKASQLKQELLQDMDMKERLDNALAMAYQQKNITSTINSDIDAEIFKEIPDFKDKAKGLGEFAIKDGRFEPMIIETILDPTVYIPGIMKKFGVNHQQASAMAKKAVLQSTRALHNFYMRLSGKGLQGKEVRTPPRIEGSGARGSVGDTTLNGLRQQAVKSGDPEDWTRYYSKEAELSRRK